MAGAGTVADHEQTRGSWLPTVGVRRVSFVGVVFDAFRGQWDPSEDDTGECQWGMEGKGKRQF